MQRGGTPGGKAADSSNQGSDVALNACMGAAVRSQCEERKPHLAARPPHPPAAAGRLPLQPRSAGRGAMGGTAQRGNVSGQMCHAMAAAARAGAAPQLDAPVVLLASLQHRSESQPPDEPPERVSVERQELAHLHSIRGPHTVGAPAGWRWRHGRKEAACGHQHNAKGPAGRRQGRSGWERQHDGRQRARRRTSDSAAWPPWPQHPPLNRM